MDNEPITAKKFITGIVQPKTGLKALAFLPWLLLFLFIGFGVYKAYFKKPLPNQNITVGQGGQVTIRNEAAKRHLILFAEPYIGVDTKQKASIGTRVGCRWEF